ncbi:hypothetical protein O6H91_14G023600 [Diphasiastrum complanatum]|uniref:Uncharacterized protein n=1 Tax=Diphasiastrum complanatum TaxID=34168 RepID=A0ACC2BMC8_DIPCM|nr:hypothetical protein O6H91_14G023600 [Diphasiastrum complanatum]
MYKELAGMMNLATYICGILVLAIIQIKVMGWKMDKDQSLSKFNAYDAVVRLDSSVTIRAFPAIIGLQGQHAEYVTVTFNRSFGAASTDWIGVFSPSKFNASICLEDAAVSYMDVPPFLCTSPIKYQYANFSSTDYGSKGEGSLKFRLINQRNDFSFAFFSGDLDKPVLLAVSNVVTFTDPKAPVYPRLALGQAWNEITVTWTSGYSLYEATPIVHWGHAEDKDEVVSGAGTLSFSRGDMCGAPARTVGWRDPGYIHTSFLKELWPNTKYFYNVGHILKNGSAIWGPKKFFNSSPFPGDVSLQRVIIFGDMGKGERDGSNEADNYQPGALNTTDRLIEDLDNIDIVLHIGDITYSNGYVSQWDQFTEQVEQIASRVPYMIASGNHERDWPNSGSFYQGEDSGGECGVTAETMFNMPTRNKAQFWYAADYGMFHFCIADSEHDWREGTEQYKFIEECLAVVDRQRQPWLIFIAHRVLGYSSSAFYATQGTFAEPLGRESLQKLWQKYKVDIAFYGHVHNYERTCPVYENICTSQETENYSGTFNSTIHVVVGGGGSHLSAFTPLKTTWSVYRDIDFGFTKLTAFNHSTLLFEYKKSSNGNVYDKFWITREYKDVLGCDTLNNCPSVTLAS